MLIRAFLFSQLCLLILVALPSRVAWATACSNAGQIEWEGDGSSQVLMFCNGSNWISADQGATATVCSATAGTFQYNSSSGIYEFCGTADGKWHTMKGASAGTCSTAGQLYFNGTTVVWCDGSNLWNSGTATTCTATKTSGSSYTVPTHWGTPNIIWAVGAGGGGGGSPSTSAAGVGGAGGNSSKVSNISLTGGATITYAIGTGGGTATNGGTGGTGGDTYLCSGTSNCASIGGTAVVVGAKGGPGGAGSTTAGTAVAVASNVPSGAGYVGGNGAAYYHSSSKYYGGGGGGAAGPNGAGANASTYKGGKGDAGSGGAAGSASAGGNGAEWGTGLGSGGGGGGSKNTSNNGYAGGNYGGGGGGAPKSTTKTSGAGTGGIIYLNWTSTLNGSCL